MRTEANKELWWMVRILSGLLIAFSIFMFVTQTFDSKRTEPIEISSIIGLSLAGIGLIGLGLAWKWELVGGIIAFVSFIAIGLMEPSLFSIPLVYIYPANAILFILFWLINNKIILKNK